MRAALTIDRLGAAGDGLAGDVAVPFALPQERVVASVSGKKARLIEIEQASPARAVPPCRHFGWPGDGCGGCKLQHLQPEDYCRFKEDRLLDALRRAGLEVPKPAFFASPSKTRRRAGIAFERRGGSVVFGFRELLGHRLVPMAECHILAPALFSLAEGLGGLLKPLPWGGTVEAAVTLTETGADVALSGIDEGALSYEAREAAAAEAGALGIARLSLGGVPLAERTAPRVTLGGVGVALPAGGFLQATAEGERQLTALVTAGVGDAPSVADLFCGIGTFALPLSEKAKVLAAEGAPEAAEALRRAALSAGRPVEVLTRDLFERPLLRAELSGIEAVVLDPPRAGAAAQVAALAAAEMPRIVYVSCNPGALSRDASLLAPCYDLTALSLVDQFLWSPHIEAVAVFERSA